LAHARVPAVAQSDRGFFRAGDDVRRLPQLYSRAQPAKSVDQRSDLMQPTEQQESHVLHPSEGPIHSLDHHLRGAVASHRIDGDG
jgi:hypothetical protein